MNHGPTPTEYYRRRYERPPGAMRDYGAYLELVPNRSGERILDVGCGEGFLLVEAEQAGLLPVGVELVRSAGELARKRVPTAQVLLGSGEALPFEDDSFDIVTCLGSLEHFSDPSQGVHEMTRVLRSDGNALIVVPNRRFPGWLVGRAPGTEQREVGEILLTREGWQDLIEQAGLEIVHVSREPWYTKPYASRILRFAIRLAWLILPLRWTYQFAFLCRPSTNA